MRKRPANSRRPPKCSSGVRGPRIQGPVPHTCSAMGPRQSGRHQRGSRAGTWQKVISSASSQQGSEALVAEVATLREQLAEMTKAQAALQVEISALQSQLAGERKWRMHYEGMVRTSESGLRDLEREVREAAWPSRCSEVRVSTGVARCKRHKTSVF